MRKLLTCLLVGSAMCVANHAMAQNSVYSVDNGDFETDGGTSSAPSGFVGSGSLGDSTSGFCSGSEGKFYYMAGGQYLRSTPFTIPPAYQTTSGTQAVITVPMDLNQMDSTGTLRRQFRFYSGSGNPAYTTIDTPAPPVGQWVRYDSLSNTPLQANIPHNTQTIEIGFLGLGAQARNCVDNLGLISLTLTSVDCSSDDCGNEYVEPSEEPTDVNGSGAPDYGNPLEWILDGDNGENAFDFAVDALDAFECGDPVSFVADKVGGGGLFKKLFGYVVQIAKSQIGLAEGTAALNCKADAANELQQTNNTITNEIYEGQTNVENLPANADYSPSLWNPSNGPVVSALDATTSTIANLSAGIGSDNLITANARTNRLLVANIKQQAALSDRLVGSEPVPEYRRSGGRRINSDDVTASDEMEFAEGDYEGTADRISELGQDSEPDFEAVVDLEDADAQYTGRGACLALGAEMPTGEGSAYAYAKMKWNASQRLASSDLGNFVCSIIDQPARSATSICLAQGLNVSAVAVGSSYTPTNEALCIYGPDAPTWSNYLLNLIPLILMLFASIATFKRFF